VTGLLNSIPEKCHVNFPDDFVDIGRQKVFGREDIPIALGAI